MKFEVLLSAMHQTDFSIAYKSKISSDLLIVNQCDHDGYEEIEVEGHKWRMIHTTERGVAKSRNMALRNAHGEICLLCDDDEIFNDNYVDLVINGFLEIPSATAIAFNVHRINYVMKKNYYRIAGIREAPKHRGYQTGMLAFKRNPVIKAGITFNEKFGSGSQWGGGEEILFESDIRARGLKLYEHPTTIATIDYGGSSQWFRGYDERFFYNLGAFTYYINNYHITFHVIARVLYESFYKLRKEKYLSPFGKMKWMFKGMRGIRKNIPFDESKYSSKQ